MYSGRMRGGEGEALQLVLQGVPPLLFLVLLQAKLQLLSQLHVGRKHLLQLSPVVLCDQLQIHTHTWRSSANKPRRISLLIFG